LRKALLKVVDPKVIETIAEISHNILRGNIKLGAKTKRKIAPYKKVIRKIATNISDKRRRKILIQKGGFLPMLISTILTGLLGKLLEKYGQ
jgi:hypothetical protein